MWQYFKLYIKEKKEKLVPFKQKEKELNKKENDLEQEENIYFPKKKTNYNWIK